MSFSHNRKFAFFQSLVKNSKFLSSLFFFSLRGSRLKGMGKGVLGARETRGGARGLAP